MEMDIPISVKRSINSGFFGNRHLDLTTQGTGIIISGDL